MNIKIAIVDDTLSEYENLKNYISKYFKNSQDVVTISYFSDGKEIVAKYKGDFDIILMDIDMPIMDGMTAAFKIREIDKEVVIVFITNLSTYAIKGYEVNALSYLLKPLNYFIFSEQMNKIVERLKKNIKQSILVTTSTSTDKVLIKDILYIESDGHYVEIVTSKEKYFTNGPLKKYEQNFSDTFAKCNNNYLVNLSNVASVKGDLVLLSKCDYKLKISRQKKKVFLESLMKHIGGN
ncbi:MAG: LytTR family DNA-binding domain-containing protein [Bacillales bacterium]|jgi:DNA-binding LytR/AlgR family response regulator|nr:LytTR family DNA-binding domain-containing protein [Bacillales bacterium]